MHIVARQGKVHVLEFLVNAGGQIDALNKVTFTFSIFLSTPAIYFSKFGIGSGPCVLSGRGREQCAGSVCAISSAMRNLL
jgi:hypothetical protein